MTEDTGPVGRIELNSMVCETPNCSHDHTTLYMHAGCHPEAGLWVGYIKAQGILTVACAECECPMGAFWIGDGPPKDQTN